MMDRIALIFGYEAYRANSYSPTDLRDALDGRDTDIRVATGRPDLLSRDMVKHTLDEMARGDSPSLIFGILNGRSLPGMHPLQVCGNQGSDEIKQMFERLIKNTNGRKAPLDVFLLLADTPRLIHHYAQRLPHGSTVVAIETDIGSQHNTRLWRMLEQKQLHKDFTPNARNLLLQTMLAANEAFGLPEIAVSGQQRMDVRNAWDKMLEQGTISQAAQDELKIISRYMSQPQADNLDYVMRTIKNQPDKVTPLDNHYYACAVATLWDQLYVAPPLAPVPVAVPVAAVPVVKQKTVTAAPTEAVAQIPVTTHARPRLSQSQIGALWQKGKPPHKQNPLVVKRLLRHH